MDNWQQISAADLLNGLERGEIKPQQVIDVREPLEWDYYHLGETRLMPMNTIPEQIQELTQEEALYIVCAHGVRSEAVCSYLHKKGYGNLHNVNGGMAAVALMQGFEYD